MIKVSFSEVAEVLETELPALGHSPDVAFPRVSIDSRALQPGDCFVAIKGPRFDGHDFIPGALAGGARVVVHSDSVSRASRGPGVAFLKVCDTTQALQQLARLVRDRWAGPLVAVTGSMGKTTTRRFASTLLRRECQVCESPGNLNNHFGVPLSLLRLQEGDGVAVLELGMNHAGEIRRLSSICRPDVAVMTNIAPVHLEFFRSLDDIAAAKAEILEGLREGGSLLFNGDDVRLREVARAFEGRAVDFGIEDGRQIRVTSCGQPRPEGMEIEVQTPAGRFHEQVVFSGRHYLYNLAAAVAVAFTLGVSDERIRAGVGELVAPSQRGRIRPFVSRQGVRFTLVDESYNSNPRALASVLEDLASWEWEGRKVVVVGDMLELGPDAPVFHETAGRSLAGRELALVVTVGPLAAHIREGAVAAGMDPEQVFSVEDAKAAAGLLSERARDGDLILVKGSRGMRLDRMILELEGA